MAIAVQFAVPTTLNNLAGGIAVGISPWLSGTSAFCASLAMMATGFYVGQRLPSVLRGLQLDVRLFSCVSSLGPRVWAGEREAAGHVGGSHALSVGTAPFSYGFRCPVRGSRALSVGTAPVSYGCPCGAGAR